MIRDITRITLGKDSAERLERVMLCSKSYCFCSAGLLKCVVCLTIRKIEIKIAIIANTPAMIADRSWKVTLP